MTRWEVLLQAQQQQNSLDLEFQRQQNAVALDYQKSYLDLYKPKKKKFLGFIGGSIGDALNGIAEVAAPIVSGGTLAYNQYEPGYGQAPQSTIGSANYSNQARNALSSLSTRLGIKPFGYGVSSGSDASTNGYGGRTVSSTIARVRTPGINPNDNAPNAYNSVVW